MMDSSDVVALVMMVGLLILAAGGLGFMAGQHVSDQDNRAFPYDDTWPDPPDDLDMLNAEVPGPLPERDPVALPVDPNNPPTWRIARRDRTDVVCNCHGRPVRQGERLLFWPMGDGVMRVYHDDATEAAGQ
jgi:hypothetical protein